MISEQLKILRDIVELIETMEKQADFVMKDEIVNHLCWAGKDLAENVWQSTLNAKPNRDY